MEIHKSMTSQGVGLTESLTNNSADVTNDQALELNRGSITVEAASLNMPSDFYAKELEKDADNIKNSDSRELQDAVKKVESFLNSQNRDLAFTVDDQTERTIVTVKESSSGDVIRQIPSEEVIKLASRIQELQEDVGNSVGVFINSEI
jgi:flagellar protein FlaG